MSYLFLFLMTLSAFAANSRDNLLFIKSDYCICKDGRPVSFGNCSSFCADKNTNGAELLFANFTVAENKKYKNVHEWCTKKAAWDFRKPKCVVSLKNEAGIEAQVVASVTPDSNSITADLSSLSYDQTQIFGLVETISKGKSNLAQLVKLDSDIDLPLPVQTGGLTQFTCVAKAGKEKFHFYFSPFQAPDPQGINSNFICHDSIRYGERDDAVYPRLEEKPHAIASWPNTSPLFYDNDGNGNLDINDAIRQKTKRFGGSIPLSAQFFSYLTLPGNDQLYAMSGVQKQSSQFTMYPWIDQTTYYSYCVNETHYNSQAPLWRAIGEVVGVPTEGLYAGMRVEDNTDIILLRESDIKAVWFYQKNGQIKVPTDETVSRVTVYFYYPLDKVDPYVKKPNQKVYQVKSAQELGISTNNNYPPHDRKLACIPKN